MKKYTTEILDAEDGTGDGILQLPPEFCNEEDWREGDTISFSVKNGNIVLQNKSKELRESKNRHLP